MPTPGAHRRIAAEIVSPVWACLVFPGFPSRNTLRLNRNLGTRNDRVLDARALFDCRALLFRIRGSVLDVEQVSESSCLRVSARERSRQVNLCHGNPAPPSSVRSRRRPNGHARAYRRGTQSSPVSDERPRWGPRVGRGRNLDCATKLRPSTSLGHAGRAGHAPVFCHLTICAE